MNAIDFGKLLPATGLDPQLYSVGGIISRVLLFLFVIAGLALLIYLIYGGFQLMTSGGDPAKTKEARAIITNGIVGFLIIFTAYWVVQALSIAFGIGDIRSIFSPESLQ